MNEIPIVNFENKDYIIIKSIHIDANEYLVLSNVNNTKDYTIRRLNNGFLYGLTEQEFKKVINEFQNIRW